MSQLTSRGSATAARTGIRSWLSQQKSAASQRCKIVSLSELDSWQFSHAALEHKDKAYFSVVGVGVRDGTTGPEEDYAMILQPEIGVLGFLLTRQHGQASLLVQAKAEPGNVDDVQIAPTVQATVSNYTRAHGGLPTPYLEHFLDPTGEIIADSLQSEQGSCFIGKYNRNVICRVQAPAPAPVNEFWRWCSWESLQPCLATDFLVNTDARSVLVCGDWEALADDAGPFASAACANAFARLLRASYLADDRLAAMSLSNVQDTLRRWRSEHRMDLESKPLSQLRGWQFDESSLGNSRAGIAFVGASVETGGREVPHWDQPLLRQDATGEIALVCQQRNGVLQFLLRASCEIGFREAVQFGPSLQTDEGAIAAGELKPCERVLLDLVRSGAAARHASCLQSDEGGRFYRRVSRYSIAEVGKDETIPDHAGNCWVTLNQIARLTGIQGMLTNETRSAVSLLLAYL